MDKNPPPDLGKWSFRIFSIGAPVVVAILFALQSQIDSGGAFEWRPLASASIGAVLVAYANLARAGTERAESNAEVRTGIDADDDQRVENPE